MSADETLNALLPLFTRYYNVTTEGIEEPFDAEAVFESHNEQYYLVKAAKVADIDTKEYVFFAKRDNLSADDFAKLDKVAWERGTSRAKPGYNHKSTDVTLVIVADTIEDTAKDMIKKSRHYKSYKWGFYGWSIYRLVAIESSCGKAYYNHRGKSLEKLVGNIK